MTDQTAAPGDAVETTTPGRALTVQRERLITSAPSAMFDSAAFEHLQRVATVLAHSGLVPKSLTHEKNGNDEVELPLAMVVARCTLLADQAQRAGADVIAYIQSTSIINGRLMHEGKLVNAVVRQRLGVHLRYRFGLWDTDHIEFAPMVPMLGDDGQPVMGDDGKPVMIPKPDFLHGAGERLACRIFDRDSPDDYVEGSVAQWKTTRSGSPWASQANWPRQLRYRGAREWARAYDPGAMLGMLADGDEDIDDMPVQTARPVGLMQRLKGEQSGDGFNADQVETQTRKPRRKKGAEEPEEQQHAKEPDPEPCEHAWVPSLEGTEQMCSKCGLVEALSPQTDAPAEETQPEAHSGSEPTKSAAEPASSEASPSPGGTATSASPSEPDDLTRAIDPAQVKAALAEANKPAHAKPGEVYVLKGDGYNADKRRLIYKDGNRFSTVHKTSEGRYTEYAQHAPEPVVDDGIPEHVRDDVAPASVEEARTELEGVVEGVEAYQDGEEVPEGVMDPTGTGGAPAAAPEPATSATATPASDAGATPAEASGPSAPADGAMPPALREFIEAVESVGTWADVKKAMAAFFVTDTFKGFPIERQNKVRASTWEACAERKASGDLKDLPDHAEDVSAFRLWIEAQPDPDAIKGTYYTLQQTSKQWKDAPEGSKSTVARAVAERLKAVGG